MRLTRRFLGNLFPTNTMESNELKAYTNGHNQFTFGREKFMDRIIPKMHDVRQEYFYI